MKILVTGGAGFIGSNFVHRLVWSRPNARIVVLDKLTYAGNLRNLADALRIPRVSFVRGDVCDRKIVARVMKGCDFVVHFAAETHVDRSIVDADAFLRTDVYGTYVMLETARAAGIRRFIQISTDEVYGEATGHPCREDDPLNPRSPYAASKAGADRLAFSYHETYGLPVVITRCGNNYGPYQHPEKLIPLFITNALEGKKLPLYGDGRNRRDWIHVEDHCAALDLLLTAKGVDGEVFNVSAREERENRWIAEKICEVTDSSSRLIKRVADRPGHVRRHAVDSRKLSRATGWRPRVPLDEGLERTAVWYREHRDWWVRIKEGGDFQRHSRTVYGRRWR